GNMRCYRGFPRAAENILRNGLSEAFHSRGAAFQLDDVFALPELRTAADAKAFSAGRYRFESGLADIAFQREKPISRGRIEHFKKGQVNSALRTCPISRRDAREAIVSDSSGAFSGDRVQILFVVLYGLVGRGPLRGLLNSLEDRIPR